MSSKRIASFFVIAVFVAASGYYFWWLYVGDRQERYSQRETGQLAAAERTMLSAESAVDQARLARFGAHVGLYRALGGGWDETEASGDAGSKPM